MIGKKLMPEISLSQNHSFDSAESAIKVETAVLKTLAFFDLHELPISRDIIHQLLYQVRAEKIEVDQALERLTKSGHTISRLGLFRLQNWDHQKLSENRREIRKRWNKVHRFFGVLSLIPFIDHLSIINSLAFGNAHQESDIDFFVVAKSGKLYLTRSIIIVLFKILGVYKTRTKVNEQFCFGFYVTADHLELHPVLLEGEDPHFAFWFASFAPLLNSEVYDKLTAANDWVYKYFPNLEYTKRSVYIQKPSLIAKGIKKFLEIILWLPALLLEPLLSRMHIRHTFNLPENHWSTSTTVANAHMLKLHALDPRLEIREQFEAKIKDLLDD